MFETTVLGIFGGSNDVYKEDMSVDHFKDNYDRITGDLQNGKNLTDVTRAFADVAPEYPKAVIENGTLLYKNSTSSNSDVKMRSMTALVRADLATDDDFLGEDSIDLLNAMLEDENPDVRTTAADLLTYGVQEKGYYVNGHNIETALLSEQSIVARVRAAQALRMYLEETQDYDQLKPCVDAVGRNFEPALQNLDNEWWYGLIKELLVLTDFILDIQPQVAEDAAPFLKQTMNTMDGELMRRAMKVISSLPKASLDTFEELEPIVGSIFSSSVPDVLKEHAVMSYHNYIANGGNISVVEERSGDIVENYYRSLDPNPDNDSPRTFIVTLVRNIVRNGSGQSDVLREIGVFERELEVRDPENLGDQQDYEAVKSTLSLYLLTAQEIGVEPLCGHIRSVPKYMESDDSEIRESAATVLMEFVKDNMDELDRVEADVERIKRVIKVESDDINNVDRVFEGLRSTDDTDGQKSSGDIENEYLTRNPDVDFTDYIGMKELKNEAKRKIIEPLEEPELHDEFGVDIQRGFIFHGLPGTGKTYFAKSLAGEFNLSYMEIDAADLTSKWIGEGAKNVSEMFDVAMDNEPCLIFIDEIDAIASDRSGVQQTKSERQMVNQLLQSISRINDKENKVVVIAATNRIDDVDSAILRTGRLGTKIEFTKPKAETRVKIFRQHCKPDTSQLSDEWLMEETEEMVQSDLAELSNRASYNALDRYKNNGGDKAIRNEDVEEVLSKMKE